MDRRRSFRFRCLADCREGQPLNERGDILGAPLPRRQRIERLEARESEKEIPTPPRFLPEYDNVLLSHADRRAAVAEEGAQLLAFATPDAKTQRVQFTRAG